jgi:hypothetical protein
VLEFENPINSISGVIEEKLRFRVNMIKNAQIENPRTEV